MILLTLWIGSALGKLVKVSNDVISVGADSDYGCSITYVSDAHNSDNLINLYDKGREIQQSYYAGPTPYKNGKFNGNPWPWNPTTAGDLHGNKSPCSIQRISDVELYMVTTPLQWALNNVSCECKMEQWINLDGTGFIIRNKLTNWRSDQGNHLVHSQEMPAVYVIGKYFRLMTYNGDQLFKNDPLNEIEYPVPGPPWINFKATENWAAFLNADLSYGLGVMNENTTDFLGGFTGKKGSGGVKDNETGYIAPLVNMEIPDIGQVEWKATFAVGNIQTIRSYFYQKKIRII
jgi:hypothetical protein